MIAAITRNEIAHRKLLIDDSQDSQVKVFGKALGAKSERVSIGNQQMQSVNIERLLKALDSEGKPLYPQLQGLKNDAERMALDPKYGALLLGAYLQDVATRLENGEDPIPTYNGAHRSEILQKIRTLWASGDPENRTDALIRSYNPGDGQVHVDNVRRHLREIKTNVGKLFI